MKSILALMFLLPLMACNSGADHTTYDSATAVQPDTSTTFTPIDSSSEFLDTFTSNLKPWLEQSLKKPDARLEDFKYADNWVEDSLIIRRQNLDRDFLKSYESVLVYSPDHQKVIDMGTYGTIINKNKNEQDHIQSGEPDTEIAVIDLPSKERRRIFFSGPGTNIEKGFWMNDSTVLLAGKANEQNAQIPMIWLVTLSKNRNEIKRYEYTLQ
jgi:hypothetical protein